MKIAGVDNVMKPIRLWFNRTFSTAAHYFRMIKENPDNREFHIFATHPKRHSLILQVADHAEIEPSLKGMEYIEFCLDFCRRNQIDVFIPHHEQTQIAKHISAFHEIGTRVLVCQDANLLDIIADKGSLYESLKSIKAITLPDYHIVSTPSEFIRAYLDLKSKGHTVCMKPTNGEGGKGFRIIEDKKNASLDSLFGSLTPRISFDEVYSILSNHVEFPSLMVMEYLNGYEYSVDCLAFNGKLLAAVPRKKESGRMQLLEENHELIRAAAAITKHLQIPFNFNIQFIYKNGVPMLLEINPRMSGGLYMSCMSGVNFPYEAIKLLLDGQTVVPTPHYGIYCTHMEKELELVRVFNDF
jgi:biotin carboxylase